MHGYLERSGHISLRVVVAIVEKAIIIKEKNVTAITRQGGCFRQVAVDKAVNIKQPGERGTCL